MINVRESDFSLSTATPWSLVTYLLAMALLVSPASNTQLPAQAVVANQEAEPKPEAPTAAVRIETADFARVIDRLETEVDRVGRNSVLLVVDVDNTLLAMQQGLGSDQWFNWQAQMLQKDPQSTDLVASDIGGLLQAQGVLFALSQMHPPEPSLPELITKGQAMGCKAIILTSRGPDYRDATERELKRNGYDFSDSAVNIKKTPRGSFLPFDKSKPDAQSTAIGLSVEELAKLRDPREISYSKGIMMVAGQHKGYMLRTLLARSRREFKTIIFADDHQKHTNRLHDAFADTGIQVITFRYSREDGNVEAFKDSDKRHVVRNWQLLDAVIQRTLAH